MHSTIDRRYQLNRVLLSHGAHELYASTDFSLEDESPTLVALIGQKSKSVGLLLDMSDLFNGDASIHITANPHALCLSKLKIVWRDGAWYV